MPPDVRRTQLQQTVASWSWTRACIWRSWLKEGTTFHVDPGPTPQPIFGDLYEGPWWMARMRCPWSSKWDQMCLCKGWAIRSRYSGHAGYDSIEFTVKMHLMRPRTSTDSPSTESETAIRYNFPGFQLYPMDRLVSPPVIPDVPPVMPQPQPTTHTPAVSLFNLHLYLILLVKSRFYAEISHKTGIVFKSVCSILDNPLYLIIISFTLHLLPESLVKWERTILINCLVKMVTLLFSNHL